MGCRNGGGVRPMKECYDNVRFSLGDESGELRFESFEIVGMPECQETADELTRYLLGRPLREVDLKRIRSMDCRGSGQCMATVASVIEEHQQMFGAAGRAETADRKTVRDRRMGPMRR